MQTMPLTNQETLAKLKDAFFKTLSICNESNNVADLNALRDAENAYMCFIETHD